jgi:primosomal protein N' (replication factor Y)
VKSAILRIAVPSPLSRSFDYLAPAGCDPTCLQPGVRLRIPFGRGEHVGVLLGVGDHSEMPAGKLKAAHAVLDETPLLPPGLLALVQWASHYYRYPIGEALATALPVLLRRGHCGRIPGIKEWRLTAAGRAVAPEQLQRAPRQLAVLQQLRRHPEGLPREALEVTAATLRALLDKGWVEERERPCLEAIPARPEPPPALNAGQSEAVAAVSAQLGGYGAFLLEGVTGSGKTEVYMQLIAACLEQGRQALVLVPEIGLTPQLVARFRGRFSRPLAVLHSGLNDRERLCAWQSAAAGEAAVVIGTRSAVFTPLPRLGLVLVDEEHDASLKQQEGFRYSARDLAVWRAHREGVPVVLGSATPSLESLHNVAQGRYRRLHLPERAGSARPPRVALLDIRRQPLDSPLAPALLASMERHLAAGGQVLLFLNRRGFAPTLLCHECGWLADCPRCDAHMTLHQRAGRLRCHHCGHERALLRQCPSCGSPDLLALGKGTERIEDYLAERFPDQETLRIDRDTTRRKGTLEAQLARATAGQARILVGTQMLAKGHHFPLVSLVAILDADQGLFSNDFRAAERLAQLIVQVAGRAGRADRAGEVVIQTHHPEHPLLVQLVTQGYGAFAEAALEERRAAGFPPFASLALLRAEASQREPAMAFLDEALAAAQALGLGGVQCWGPVPASMERRAGRFRAQLMLQAAERGPLQQLLDPWVRALEQLKSARKVRWSLDVDPADTL